MWYSEIGLHTTEDRMRATLVLASRFDEVARFMKRLLKLLTTSDFGASDLFAIQLAVEEALVNAVKHGNQMDRQKRVHLRFAMGSKGFRIQIRDEGRGFNHRAVPDPTDPENLERPTGRGLWLIRHYMHEVRFNAKGNAVTLVRRRSPV
jgi:serine/threonine-protein kinase RsbW